MKVLIPLAFLICSCQSEALESDKMPSIHFTHEQCEGQYLDYHNQLESNFRAFYFGPKTSKIVIDGNKILQQNEMLNHFYKVMHIRDPNLEYLLGRYPIEAEGSFARITIDTSQELALTTFVNDSYSIFEREKVCAFHYPVIIENIYPSFFQVAYGDQLSLTLEAKAESGEWKVVTHPYVGFCGTGEQYVSLSSREVIVSSVPVLTGAFKTQGRLTLGRVYSNVINISVDTLIFNIPDGW